jgi:hypothetical protein
MGKRVLLSLLLCIIVTGTTVVLAVSASGAHDQQSNKDVVMDDCLHIAASAVGYYHKPAVLRGGNNSFDNIKITDCGIPKTENNNTGRNENGTYAIHAENSRLTVTGISGTDDKSTVVLVCDMARSREDRVTITCENR